MSVGHFVRPAIGSDDGVTNMKRSSMQIGLGIALGAGIGIAVDLVLGTGGAWLAIGIAIGVVIGASMGKRKTDSPPARMERAGSE